jgi:NAD(P)H-dependent nitrite reductase small subunit
MPIKARCGRADGIPAGGSKVVEIKDQTVAIFRMGDELYAVDNTCPHQGGPLGEGYLEEGGIVSCPWHGWTFDLKTGVSPIDADLKIGCYQVEVEDGEIIVMID